MTHAADRRPLTRSGTPNRTSTPVGVARLAAGLVLAAGLAWAAPAFGQATKDDERFAADFSHYVRIDRFDLAKANAEALLKRLPGPVGSAKAGEGLSFVQFAEMVEKGEGEARFIESALRAERTDELATLAAKLRVAFEQGVLDRARSAAQIERNIKNLSGDLRARLVGRDGLVRAGEYAVPQLFEQLVGSTNPALSAEVRQVLVDMGRQAVGPLTAGIMDIPPAKQEVVAGVLGDIRYRSAVPVLHQLARGSANAGVRAAAERALQNITGGFDTNSPVTDSYLELAESYYSVSASLTSFPGEPMQLLWRSQGGKIFAVPIKTEVFHHTAAMEAAEKALALDAKNERALALWLSANFIREESTPKDYKNPAIPESRRDGMFYAVAAGPSAAQRVLGRGLDSRNASLTRKAIAALSRTAGPAVLASMGGERNALLEALRFPNRRVQLESALALGAAQPTDSFAGSERVVPILASAVRDAGAKFAVVVAADAESQQVLVGMLRGQGYTVLPPGNSLDQVAQGIAEAPGVDLVVTNLPTRATDELLSTARGDFRLFAAPTLAFVSADGMADLAPKYQRNDRVRLIRLGTDNAQQAESIKQLVTTAAGGPVTPEEESAYQARALSVLRDLAVSNNPALKVVDSAGALMTALGEPKTAPSVRERIAEVLSHVNDPRVQGAIFDAAMSAQGEDMIALLRHVGESAKRYGNRLNERQVGRLLAAATTGTDAEATARSALIGTLNLRNDNLVPLILSGPQGK